MKALCRLRRRLAVATVGGVAVGALWLAGCDDGPAPPPVNLDHTPAPIATEEGLHGGPISPPASGAMLGAWVKPRVFSQPERIRALDAYEARLGRRLDIVNTYRPFTEEFFTASDKHFMGDGSVLMLSWAGTDTRAITLGRHDDLIRDRARKVASLGRPLMIRFRWEMDRPNLRASMWSGPDFIASWVHVRKIFQEEGATNASWVWCPTAEGFHSGEAPKFYPGDDQVDWLCVDVYATSTLDGIGDLLDPFLRWAAEHPRPIIIGEYGVSRAHPPAERARWLRNATAAFKANPQIKAVSYFESDPEETSTLQFSLTTDPTAMAAFVEMARDPYFNPENTR
jgi:hypothetical protein